MLILSLGRSIEYLENVIKVMHNEPVGQGLEGVGMMLISSLCTTELHTKTVSNTSAHSDLTVLGHIV